MEESQEKPRRLLIIDTDSDFCDQIVEDYKVVRVTLGKAALQPAFSDTVRSSQSKLSDRDYAYAAVFLNPSLGAPAWQAVLRAVHQYRSGVPAFIIYDGEQLISPAEAECMGVAGVIPKPLTYAKMLELASGNGNEEAPIVEKSIEEEPAEEQPSGTLTDADLIEVNLSNLTSKVKSAFDIFVRLGSGKFVRVLKAGDGLSADRLETYQAKGVKTLYVLKSAQADYLNFLDSIVAEVLGSKSVTVEVKANQVLAHGLATVKLLKEAGFGDKSLERAQQYVLNTTEMVNQIAGDSGAVKQLLTDIAGMEHAVGVTMLASLMIKHIGGTNTTVFNGVGLACFLHDISLLGQPPAVRDEIEARMTKEQLEVFHAHPARSAEMLAQMKKVPPMVVTAVSQHHRRVNGGGFPKGEDSDEMNSLAELIGLGEEFMKLAEMAKDTGVINPFDVLKVQAEKEFSAPIVDAFMRTFAAK